MNFTFGNEEKRKKKRNKLQRKSWRYYTKMFQEKNRFF